MSNYELLKNILTQRFIDANPTTVDELMELSKDMPSAWVDYLIADALEMQQSDTTTQHKTK